MVVLKKKMCEREKKTREAKEEEEKRREGEKSFSCCVYIYIFVGLTTKGALRLFRRIINVFLRNDAFSCIQCSVAITVVAKNDFCTCYSDQRHSRETESQWHRENIWQLMFMDKRGRTIRSRKPNGINRAWSILDIDTCKIRSRIKLSIGGAKTEHIAMVERIKSLLMDLYRFWLSNTIIHPLSKIFRDTISSLLTAIGADNDKTKDCSFSIWTSKAQVRLLTDHDLVESQHCCQRECHSRYSRTSWWVMVTTYVTNWVDV